MNHYFPDWNIIESDLPAASQRKPLRLDQELVELLWENGQVVHNNQTHKNQGLDQNESRKVSKCNQASNHVEGSSAENLAQENELISWNHHCQVDDPFEKELSSFLLPEFIPISSNSSLINDSPIDNTYKFCNTDGPQINHLLPYTSHSENLCVNSSLSPQVQAQPHANFSGIVGTINKRAPNINGCGFGSIGGSVKMREVKENSGKTVGSSHCGSNQVIYDADISLASCSGIGREVFNTTPEEEDFGGKVASKSETIAGSLSSGGSGFTTWNQSTGTNSSKRKNRETENSESQSEAALLEPVTRKKTAQEFVTTRKLRASEVHNLSERRRRDRINEKMRALQELLPRSNQTDKASMLDEAIQYMKSLQLQLQMMWMGSQMAPLMYPPYMSRLEMGISPQMLPTLQSAMNLSRLPMMDQARANQAAIMNYQNQLQNYNFSDQYGAYVGFYPPVHNANQQMNMYTSYGPNMVQQNHTLPPAGDANNIGPPA